MSLQPNRQQRRAAAAAARDSGGGPPIRFWKPHEDNGHFSQWFKKSFVDKKGTRYNCAEQRMMAEKALLFGDRDAYAKIMAATNPAEMQAIGKEVRGFSEEVWNAKKYQIVLDTTFYKFSCDEEFKHILLATGSAHIEEVSPYDYVWGVGRNGTGQNLLGKALMAVRSMLRKESS